MAYDWRSEDNTPRLDAGDQLQEELLGETESPRGCVLRIQILLRPGALERHHAKLANWLDVPETQWAVLMQLSGSSIRPESDAATTSGLLLPRASESFLSIAMNRMFLHAHWLAHSLLPARS